MSPIFRSVRLSLMFLLGMAFQAWGIPLALAAADGIVALVNQVPISAAEMETAGARLTPEEGDALSMGQKQKILDDLIGNELLYEEALKQGIDKSSIVKKVMINTLLREKVYSTVRNSDFDDATLEAYFNSHRQDFIVPEKIQIKRILIRVDSHSEKDAKAKAMELYRQLVKDPALFSELATSNSEDPYRRRGGDIGFVSREGKPGFDQEVVNKAFTLPLEKVSEPFRTEEGWNILLVANRRQQVERTFSQMKGSVLRMVKNEKLKSLYEDYVRNLRSAATVEVDLEELSILRVIPTKRSSFPQEEEEEAPE